MKKTLSLFLSLVMFLSLTVPVSAMNVTNEQKNQHFSVENVQALNSLKAESYDFASVLEEYNTPMLESDEEISLPLETNPAFFDVAPNHFVTKADQLLTVMQAQNNSPSAARAGSVTINPNTLYWDVLTSGTDTTMYICPVSYTGDYSAFLAVYSTATNYGLRGAVFDANLNQVNDTYQEAANTASLFGGQRLRFKATQGQFIVIEVYSRDGSFNSSTAFSIEVNGTVSSQHDAYEPNDSINGSLRNFTYGSTISANIDNPGDMDWYTFSWTGTYKQAPYIQLNSSANYLVSIFLVNGNNLNFVGNFTATGTEFMLPYPGPSATYYISVCSLNGSTGTYSIKTTVGRCATTHVTLSFTTFSADYASSAGYGYGAKPVARYSASGKVKAVDQYGDILPDFPVLVYFEADGGGVQASQIFYTASNGIANANLSVFAGYWRLRYTVGDFTTYFDNANLRATCGYSSINSNIASIPMYYFWGIVYTGP